MRNTTITIIALFVAIAVVFNIWPQGLTGWAGTVRVPDESMEPSYDQGDVLLLRRTAVYEPADVVAFPAPGTVLVGRIVGGNPVTGYVVRGDDQLLPYPTRPTGADIVGRATVELWPVVGAIASLFAWIPSTVVAAALGALLVMWSPARLRRRYREVTGDDVAAGPRRSSRDTPPRPVAAPRASPTDGRVTDAGDGTGRAPPDGRGRSWRIPRGVAGSVAMVALVLALGWTVTTVELLTTPSTTVVDSADSSARHLLELELTAVDDSPAAGDGPSQSIRAEPAVGGDGRAVTGSVVTVGRVPAASSVLARDDVDLVRVAVRHEVEGGAPAAATVGLQARLRTPAGGGAALGPALSRLPSGDPSTASVAVDLAEVDRLGLGGSSAYEILLTPTVALDGPDDGTVDGEESFVGRPLVLRVGDTTVQLDGAMASSARLAPSDVDVQEVSVTVLGVTTGIVAARMLSLAVLLLLLAVAGLAVWIGFLRMPWDRYAVRYRSVIRDVPADVVHRGRVERVSSIADLVAIAAADRRRIRHQRLADDSHRWSLPTGDTVYVFELDRSGAPVTDDRAGSDERVDAGDPIITIHLDDPAPSSQPRAGGHGAIEPPPQPPTDPPRGRDRR